MLYALFSGVAQENQNLSENLILVSKTDFASSGFSWPSPPSWPAWLYGPSFFSKAHPFLRKRSQRDIPRIYLKVKRRFSKF
jgi:hypothetical protein